MRINRQPIKKIAHDVKVGDVLTLALPSGVRVLEVKQPGARRGPYPEACQLYEDLSQKPFPE